MTAPTVRYRVDPQTGRRAMINPDAGPPGQPETRLYSEGAFPGETGPVLAPAGSSARRITGTPYLDPDSARLPGAAHATPEQVAAFRKRVAQATLHTGRWADMALTAFCDLYALRLDNGAVLGAGSPYWAFVWPRDNAFVAIALAITGQLEDAWAALRYVYAVQEPDGQWEARYLPDGSGRVPDERGRQDDGIGYTLWATWVVSQLSPPGVAARRLAETKPGVLRALRAAGDVLDATTGLPRTSQDFWETDQPEPSLGVAGPLQAGLRAGIRLAHQLGEPAAAARARECADRLAAAITTYFAPHGYQHFVSGGGRDASVAFLLPPFVPADHVPEGAVAAWYASAEEMRVSNGGLRPAAAWPDHTTAWTPQVSLYALTAAALGDRDTAAGYLDWLDRHRTVLGCLPEKVTAAGRPAAVAPISTVAATVLIALAVLDGHRLPIPAPLVDHPPEAGHRSEPSRADREGDQP